jgi:hypothetical protein
MLGRLFQFLLGRSRRALGFCLPRGPLRCAGLHYHTVQLKTYCLPRGRRGAPSFGSDPEYHSPHSGLPIHFFFIYYVDGQIIFSKQILSTRNCTIHLLSFHFLSIKPINHGNISFVRARTPDTEP